MAAEARADRGKYTTPPPYPQRCAKATHGRKALTDCLPAHGDQGCQTSMPWKKTPGPGDGGSGAEPASQPASQPASKTKRRDNLHQSPLTSHITHTPPGNGSPRFPRASAMCNWNTWDTLLGCGVWACPPTPKLPSRPRTPLKHALFLEAGGHRDPVHRARLLLVKQTPPVPVPGLSPVPSFWLASYRAHEAL